jgi:hypothetical protein
VVNSHTKAKNQNINVSGQLDTGSGPLPKVNAEDLDHVVDYLNSFAPDAMVVIE